MKLTNNPELSKFLEAEPICSVAMQVDVSGTIHIAVLHYWHQTNPLRFYFVTDRDTEKCRLLKQQASVKAACVVGMARGTPFTVQMRGDLRICDPDAHTAEITAYYQKRQSRLDDLSNGRNVLLEFTPNWARFTEFSKDFQQQFIK